MTKPQKQAITWLEFEAQRTGKTVDEVKLEMKRRGSLNNKTTFNNLTPKERQEISRKGVKKREEARQTEES